MTRPIRIEFCGALYHVTSRGDRREAIYEDDEDRSRFLEVLAQVVADANWVCHAYCLMGNHYHLVIETPDKNLSKGMRQLNGVYTQMSNRRHGRVGHLFQGRYKAILVDADSYLRELTRYVVLNPVRAGMVAEPAAWPWSSYRATVGIDALPPWLVVDGLLAQFGTQRAQAVQRYTAFVAEGIGGESIWRHLNRQVVATEELPCHLDQCDIFAEEIIDQGGQIDALGVGERGQPGLHRVIEIRRHMESLASTIELATRAMRKIDLGSHLVVVAHLDTKVRSCS